MVAEDVADSTMIAPAAAAAAASCCAMRSQRHWLLLRLCIMDMERGEDRKRFHSSKSGVAMKR